jgi:hypothetical protein
MITEQPPFNDLRSTPQIIFSVMQGRRPNRPQADSELQGLDDSLWNLISSCWATQPSQRPHMSEVALALDQIKQR